MGGEQLKVGDELAFRGFGSTYYFHKITAITPTGRIKVGPYELTPDLRVRGRRHRSNAPPRGERVTPEIRENMLRDTLTWKIKSAADKLRPCALSVEDMQRVAEILERAVSVERQRELIP